MALRSKVPKKIFQIVGICDNRPEWTACTCPPYSGAATWTSPIHTISRNHAQVTSTLHGIAWHSTTLHQITLHRTALPHTHPLQDSIFAQEIPRAHCSTIDSACLCRWQTLAPSHTYTLRFNPSSLLVHPLPSYRMQTFFDMIFLNVSAKMPFRKIVVHVHRG